MVNTGNLYTVLNQVKSGSMVLSSVKAAPVVEEVAPTVSKVIPSAGKVVKPMNWLGKTMTRGLAPLEILDLLNSINTLTNAHDYKDNGGNYFDSIAQNMDSKKFGSGIVGLVKGVGVDEAGKAYGNFVQADVSVDINNPLRFLELKQIPQNIFSLVNPNARIFDKHDPNKYRDIQSVIKITAEVPDDRKLMWAKSLGFDKFGASNEDGKVGVVDIRYTPVTTNGKISYAPLFLLAGRDDNGKALISWAKVVRDGTGNMKLAMTDYDSLESRGAFKVKINTPAQESQDDIDNRNILNDISGGYTGSVQEDLDTIVEENKVDNDAYIEMRDNLTNMIMANEIMPRIRGTYKKGE